MTRYGWALLEVLVVTALLSISLPLLLAFFHSTIKSPKFDAGTILGTRLAANMAERYRQLPVSRLAKLFASTEEAEYLISRDYALNGPQALSAKSLAAMGYYRRMMFLPKQGLRPARLLSVVYLPSQATKTIALHTFLPQTLIKADKELEQLVKLARSLDLLDGEADCSWPSRPLRSRDELNQLLAKTYPGPGRYNYKRVPAIDGANCFLYHLFAINGKNHTLLREDLGDYTFIGGMALREPIIRRLAQVVCPSGEKRPHAERMWAIALTTQANLYLLHAAVGNDGGPLSVGQTLHICPLPQTWQTENEDDWQQGLEQALRRLGCSEESAGSSLDLQALRHRLQW